MTQIFNYDEIGGIPYSLQDKMVSGTLHVKSVVRGYHVYKDNWIPEVGDRFEVKIKEMNCYGQLLLPTLPGHWSIFKFDNFTRS